MDPAEAGYHVITCESDEGVITVPIPDDCKPLSCSLQANGGATGFLASFYDPEGHTWVVKHAPVDTGCVTVTVRVLTLLDPHNTYELHVAVTAATEGARVEELFELRRRSFTFRSARESRPVDPREPRAWPPQGRERPCYPRDLVCLCAPQPVLAGFVLCGGGFTSDYPIHSTGPAMRIAADRFYDRVLSDDAAFVAAATAAADGERSRASPSAAHALAVYQLLRSTEDSAAGAERQECYAWSVTCVPNAGLACFSMGLRTREAAGEGRGGCHVREAAGGSRGRSRAGPRGVRELLQEDPVADAEADRRARVAPHGQGAAVVEDGIASPSARGQTPRGLAAERGMRRYLLSPSRLSSSTDSEAEPLQENTAAVGTDSARRRDAALDARHGGVESGMVDSYSSIQDHRAGWTSPVGGGVREPLAADEVARELWARKRLLRTIALRGLVSVTFRRKVSVVDLALPPPHGKIRARYGTDRETRSLIDLFYRTDPT